MNAPPTIESRIAALADVTAEPPPDAWALCSALHRDVDLRVADLKGRLLGAALPWTDADKADFAWIRATQRLMAQLARDLCKSLAWRKGPGHPQVVAAAAHALYYCGEAVKCGVASGLVSRYDYPAMHHPMRLVMAAGHHRDALFVEHAGQPSSCTVEGLYFRALLLARFAGETLNDRQVEILDAWLWMWLGLLRGAAQGGDAAFRADLRSTLGLERGTRGSLAHSLYLPHAPLENACRALRRDLQRGRVVPADGLTATFPIEDHIAVLDGVRRALCEPRHAPVTRAARHPANAPIVMCLGFGRILKLVSETNELVSETNELVSETDSFRGRLRDESETGLCVEGSEDDWRDVVVGDLVVIRIGSRGPLVLGRVMRSVPGEDPGRVQLGVLRLSAAAQRIQATAVNPPGAPSAALLYLPGDDSGGRGDALIVSDTHACDSDTRVVRVDGRRFALRFNRVRQRGRGWRMVGFEVASAV